MPPRKQAAESKPPVMRLALAIGLTGVVWTALPKIIAWRQRQFADQLASHAQSSADGVAQLEVRRLAESGPEALDSLVRLGGSANTAAASAARQAVLNQLAAWEVEHRTRQEERTFASRLRRLMAALERHSLDFDPAGQAWAHAIALRVLRHCDFLPSGEAITLIATCDQVLGVCEAKIMPVTPPTAPPRTQPRTALAPSPAAAEPQRAPLARQVPTIPPATVQPPTADTQGVGDVRLIDGPIAEIEITPPDDSEEGEEIAEAPPSASDDERAEAVATVSMPLKARPRPLPPPAEDPTLIDVPSPQEARRMLRAHRQLSDQSLVARLGASSGYEALAIRQVLRERALPTAAGPKPVPRLDADQRLSERLGALPAVQARRMLRELVADTTEDTPTRLQALALLATSGDPQLEAIARRRAIEDADPQVVELATRILRDQPR